MPLLLEPAAPKVRSSARRRPAASTHPCSRSLALAYWVEALGSGPDELASRLQACGEAASRGVNRPAAAARRGEQPPHASAEAPRTTDTTCCALSRSPPTQARTTCATCSRPAMPAVGSQAGALAQRPAIAACWRYACNLCPRSSVVGLAQGPATAREERRGRWPKFEYGTARRRMLGAAVACDGCCKSEMMHARRRLRSAALRVGHRRLAPARRKPARPVAIVRDAARHKRSRGGRTLGSSCAPREAEAGERAGWWAENVELVIREEQKVAAATVQHPTCGRPSCCCWLVRPRASAPRPAAGLAGPPPAASCHVLVLVRLGPSSRRQHPFSSQAARRAADRQACLSPAAAPTCAADHRSTQQPHAAEAAAGC
jgi:hypothetical protein